MSLVVDTVTQRFGEIVALQKNEKFQQAEVSATYGLRPPFFELQNLAVCGVW